MFVNSNSDSLMRSMSLNDIKIKDIDLVLCGLLFFDPTGGNSNTFYSLIKYTVVLYLFVKYLRYAKVMTIAFASILMFSIVLTNSTYSNTHSLTWTFSGFMFGLQLLSFFLVFAEETERLSFNVMLKRLVTLFGLLLFLNDIVMVILPYDYSDSSTVYLLGNKFLVSYGHALLVGMMLVTMPDRQGRVRVVGLLCALMAYISGSATGTIVVLVVVVLSLLPWPARMVLSNPCAVAIAIASLNVLIWGSVNLFQNPYVQDFMTNVLGRSADMTGRKRLYDATFDIVQMKPLYGWGYLTDIYREMFGYGNAQNGLFHIVTQSGIIGSLFYFLGLFLAMGRPLGSRLPLFGLYAYLLAMVIGSTVEINLSAQFTFAIALICADVHVRRQGD